MRDSTLFEIASLVLEEMNATHRDKPNNSRTMGNGLSLPEAAVIALAELKVQGGGSKSPERELTSCVRQIASWTKCGSSPIGGLVFEVVFEDYDV
jgi:hypothetical protein